MSDSTQRDSASQETFGRAERRIRRIAVFGSRGSGKTCFFASIYGHSAEVAGAAISFPDDATLAYLEEMWGAYTLSETGFPDPTAAEVPSRLRFDVADEVRSWSAEILDHAGEAIERRTPANNLNDDLREIVHAWLRECEAILIFLDTSQDQGKATLERRNEVAKLLELCREECEIGRINRPLGLLLTKWDGQGIIQLPPEKDESENDEILHQKREEAFGKEERRAKQYLAANPAFRQIQSTLEKFGERVRVFPVSALGNNREHLKAPKKPYNLLRPMAWALQESDSVRFDRAQQAAAQAPRSLRKSISVMNALIHEDGITNGPIHDQINAKLAELNKKLSRWRIGSFVAAAVVLLAMCGGVYGAWISFADRQYQAWNEFCSSESGKTEASADRRADMADSILAWHGTVLGSQSKTQLEKSRLLDREIALDYGAKLAWDGLKPSLAETANAAPGDISAEKLRELEERIRKVGETHGTRAACREWTTHLASIEEKRKTVEKQDATYAEYMDKDRKLKETQDYNELIRLWMQFPSESPAQPERRKREAEELVKGYKDKEDEQRYYNIKKTWTAVISDIPGCVRAILSLEDFLTKCHKSQTYRTRVAEDVAEALKKIDNIEYQMASNQVSKASSSESISDFQPAREALYRYLQETSIPGLAHQRRPVVMASQANSCMSWFDNTLAGKKYDITFSKLNIPRGHELFENVRNPDGSQSSKYTLKLSGLVDIDYSAGANKVVTPEKATKRISNDEVDISLDELQQKKKPDAVFYKPGDSKTLDIVVLRYGWAASIGRGYEPPVNVSTPKDKYLPSILKRGLEISSNGKTAKLYIDMSDSDIPTLPTFRR